MTEQRREEISCGGEPSEKELAELVGAHVELERVRVEHDQEIGEFQNQVREYLVKQTGENIDGAGCDSGDWRDFTMSEIAQGVAALKRDKERMQRCLSFFASVIKSGESWTGLCETAYNEAMDADQKEGAK